MAREEKELCDPGLFSELCEWWRSCKLTYTYMYIQHIFLVWALCVPGAPHSPPIITAVSSQPQKNQQEQDNSVTPESGSFSPKPFHRRHVFEGDAYMYADLSDELPRGGAIPPPILLHLGFWCLIQLNVRF